MDSEGNYSGLADERTAMASSQGALRSLVAGERRPRVTLECGSMTIGSWRHNGAKLRGMTSVQIKSVPEDVHAELRRRAANEGKSLQEYLLGRLIEEARRPSLDDLLSRAGQRSGGHTSFRFSSEAVRKDRDSG